MAARQRSSKGSAGRSSNGRRASQKPAKYRFAKNVEGRATPAEREYRDYASSDLAESGTDPDVLLDVPVVKVDKIHLKLEDLEAHVALKARVLDLVSLDVGVDVRLGKVEIDIEGVEAQALLKVRLDHVAAVVDRVMTTIDRNPKLVENLGKAIEDVGGGAGQMLGETGEAVEDVGEGAEGAVAETGRGVGRGTSQLGQGAGQAVGEVGGGAGQAVGELGQAAGEPASPPARAKEAAKSAAQEIGAAAADEAKELGSAAKRKLKELGERRGDGAAEDPDATEAAARQAKDLDVDLGEIEGSGAQGRITVRDVKRAAGRKQ